MKLINYWLNGFRMWPRWVRTVYLVWVGVLTVGIAYAVGMPVAHADSLAQEICASIAGNPTEQGVYDTFHTLVKDIDDTDAAGAIADHALNDICPQWKPLVLRTTRDLQASHPQQRHIWA